jgi:hypothetical protein
VLFKTQSRHVIVQEGSFNGLNALQNRSRNASQDAAPVFGQTNGIETDDDDEISQFFA